MIYFPVQFYAFFIFLSGFSFINTDDSQDSRGRKGTIFYSSLPLPPAHEHWDIYLQLCMWGGYHVFLIATLVFTRLLLDEIYHLIELPFDWLIDDAIFVCLLDELFLGFLLQQFDMENWWIWTRMTCTPVLQANRLNKCASHLIYAFCPVLSGIKLSFNTNYLIMPHATLPLQMIRLSLPMWRFYFSFY